MTAVRNLEKDGKIISALKQTQSSTIASQQQAQ
jgi:hypothetical protein